MSIKVNEHLIPDWAIERQAEALFENVAKGMPGKPREVIWLATMDVANAGAAVAYMASLPPDANVLSMTVMANGMPFVGRG